MNHQEPTPPPLVVEPPRLVDIQPATGGVPAWVFLVFGGLGVAVLGFCFAGMLIVGFVMLDEAASPELQEKHAEERRDKAEIRRYFAETNVTHKRRKITELTLADNSYHAADGVTGKLYRVSTFASDYGVYDRLPATLEFLVVIVDGEVWSLDDPMRATVEAFVSGDSNHDTDWTTD